MADIKITPALKTIEFIENTNGNTKSTISMSGSSIIITNTDLGELEKFKIIGALGSLFSIVDTNAYQYGVNSTNGAPIFRVLDDNQAIMYNSESGTNSWRSENFIEGLYGAGWKIDFGEKNPGKSTLEVDYCNIRESITTKNFTASNIQINGNVMVNNDQSGITADIPITDNTLYFINGILVATDS